MVKTDRPQMAIRRRVACWISKATREQAQASANAPTPTPHALTRARALYSSSVKMEGFNLD